MDSTAAIIAAVNQKENQHTSLETLIAQSDSVRNLLGDAHALTANCSRQFTASKHSGKRPLSAIKHIVMHSTEGGTAAGAASWFQNPRSQGSAHICVDDNYCFRTLGDEYIPWGAKGINWSGFHIEQAGFARWTSIVWSQTHRKTLERAAYKAAVHCRRYGIPPWFVTAHDLRLGRAGVTTHNEATKAFGGSHWDPGFGWPRYLFMLRVRHHFARLDHIKQVA